MENYDNRVWVAFDTFVIDLRVNAEVKTHKKTLRGNWPIGYYVYIHEHTLFVVYLSQ